MNNLPKTKFAYVNFNYITIHKIPHEEITFV